MSHSLIRSALVALALVTFVGCGGRRSIEEDSGVAWRAVMDAQKSARPSQKLAFIDADEAKIIMDNHRTTFSRGGGGRSSGGDSLLSGGGGGGGLLNPVSVLGAITGGIEPTYDPVASDR
ncbi:MAG: hypothetical protein ACE366_20260 [Bradymonadia bacterium]